VLVQSIYVVSNITGLLLCVWLCGVGVLMKLVSLLSVVVDGGLGNIIGRLDRGLRVSGFEVRRHERGCACLARHLVLWE